MMRPLVALLALAAALAGSGQSCFRVVESGTLRPIAFATVTCTDPLHKMSAPHISDSTGRVCPILCERIEVRSVDHRPLSIALAEALALGQVQLEPRVTELAAAVVEPWPRREDRHALAATTTLDSLLREGFERSSLRSAVQWVPGVQWDERGHGGSTRLSIRGSLLRSPFGVRGVKVYWGPFPLTLADGSTPLELLDPLIVGSLDVVRSVGSPVFGSAPSGILLATAPLRPDSGTDATIEAIGGSYGYYRLGAFTRSRSASSELSVGVVHQRNDGYRDQEWSARDQAYVVSRFRHRGSISQVFLTWQSASWALPGSLDAATAEAAPRSARPYSALINAHLDKQQVMGGIASEISLTRGLRVRTGVHAQLIDKKNPYGTSPALCGYKDETIHAAGARLVLAGDQRLLGRPFAWELGIEGLLEADDWRENTYVDKQIGALKVDADTRVANLNAFLSTTTQLGRRTVLHAAVGMERSRYDHEDHLAGSDNSLAPSPAIHPLVGLEHTMFGSLKTYLRYAGAPSRPTVWELLGTAGKFNAGLGPEIVQELEFGISEGDGPSPVTTSLQFYYRRVRGLILEQAASDGVNREFTNAGEAELGGFEWCSRARLDAGHDWRATVLISLTMQFPELDLPGEPAVETPGIEPFRGGLLVEMMHRERTSVEAGVRSASDVSPALGTAELIPAYTVVHLRLSHRLGHGDGRFSLFVHCENLLDSRYNSWVQVNDPGSRYYNPAPARSFFAGARLALGRSTPRPTD